MAKKKRKRRMKVEMIGTDEGDIFVVIDGVKIARRGYPDTPQARTWVSLEPGWRVLDGPNLESICVEVDPSVLVH